VQQQQKRDLKINLLNSHEQNLSSKSVLVRKPPCVERTCHSLQTCHTQSAKSLPLVINGPKMYHKYHSGKGYVENAAVHSSREAGSIAELVKRVEKREKLVNSLMLCIYACQNDLTASGQ